MPKRFQKYVLVASLFALIIGFSMIPIRNEAHQFHSTEELAYFKAMHLSPPVDSAVIFPTASHCAGCHGTDAQGNALVDSKGRDVSTHEDWRTSMMANSAKDPFWRAKVSHEVLYNPAHKNILEDKCTSCHAPMGNYTSKYHGEEFYTMDSLMIDTVGLDGVSCMACHMMKDSLLGDLHSGNLLYDTNRVAYGPYEFPFAQPMSSFLGFTPVYSEHIHDAGLCAGCHTLITETVDLEGNPTGQTFVEQATYHEWLNSVYAEEKTGKTCQNCHVPEIDDTIVISANYIFLAGRTPFGLHELVGGNTMMLKLMKKYKHQLGIDAPDESFDETIAAAERILQQESLEMLLEHDSTLLDTAYFSVELRNKAGHKFPSGYPSRRAVVEFTVTTPDGETLFQSGALNENYEAIGHDDHYEPHYDVIRSEDEVQIYEMVIGNVNDEFSTLLERAAIGLKDNRLPPLGFTTTHEVYDTTLIAGKALEDSDFNKFNGFEGSGKDIIHYHFPLNGYVGEVNISAKVWYQSLPPRWLAPMLEESTPAIDSFRIMYNNSDRSPVLVVEKNLENIFVEETVSTQTTTNLVKASVFPNPSTNGHFTIRLDENDVLQSAAIYTLDGQLVQSIQTTSFQLSQKGVFVLKMQTKQGIGVVKIHAF